ncbi:NCS1 family transporter [Bacteroidota bacterium]
MTELRSDTGFEGLRPTEPGARVFNTVSYFLMWWSSLICAQVFILGQGLLPPNGVLNFFQGILVIFLSSGIIIVMMSLNGEPGHKYGIPYCIQARAGFGCRGSRIVEFLRILPAIVWYGVATWLGATAFDGILETLTGFTTPSMKYIYFFLFQVLQTYLAYKGIKIIRGFTVLSSIVIFVVMIYMMITVFDEYGSQLQEALNSKANWGPQFFVALTACIGALATLMLNVSDLTRYLKKTKSGSWIGHLIGVFPPWFFVIFMGLVAGAALGEFDPIKAMMILTPTPIVLVILLVFIILSQFTTNLTLNIMPPALVFMEVLKMPWGKAVILTSILGLISCPWFILGNQEVFYGFIGYYSAFFGPLLGVMLADYYVIRKKRFNVEQLYVNDSTGKYWYSGGYNMAGIIAMFAGGFIAMIPFLLPASWLIGLPLGFGFYLALFPMMIKNKYPQKELS